MFLIGKLLYVFVDYSNMIYWISKHLILIFKFRNFWLFFKLKLFFVLLLIIKLSFLIYTNLIIIFIWQFFWVTFWSWGWDIFSLNWCLVLKIFEDFKNIIKYLYFLFFWNCLTFFTILTYLLVFFSILL